MTSELHTSMHRVTDWLDPLDAHRRLTDHGPLLFDGVSAHPEARFAYVALSPRLEARIHGDLLTTRHDDGMSEERRGEPLQALGRLLDDWRFETEADGFTGGFVGYVGYGFTRAIEPTLPQPAIAADTPDVCLRLCRDVLVFDRQQQTVSLWTSNLPGETDAAGRAQQILADLKKDAGPVPPLASRDVEWTTSMDQATFEAAVGHLKEKIRNGDLFQANIATCFTTASDDDPTALFAALRDHNPSPYMCLMDFGDHRLISSSPEQLFAFENGVLRSRPIAGTRRRGQDDDEDQQFEQELLTDAKEQAEHTMLVDLLRNDIAKVSVPGSVRVPERGSVERYRRVMHLVSRVEGKVRDDTTFIDWLTALFPGGTITGAPKHRACLRIHEAEPVPRGPYTGSAGFLSWDQRTTHWNILIRTIVQKDSELRIHAGSGIVAGSDPAREWQEAGHKAQALLEAATGQSDRDSVRGDEGMVTEHGNWSPASPRGEVDARVLLVDNYDSFIHNLADYCALLGAAVKVVRNDEDVDAALQAFDPSHVILGPGPGTPEASRATLRLAKDLVGRLPVLGVCLGHQALAVANGGRAAVADRPVHGETDTIHHDGGIHDGLPSSFVATRYHSITVPEDGVPVGWHVTARLKDGTVMAMQHPDHPVIGLQYHPESIGTNVGLDILFRFLSERAT